MRRLPYVFLFVLGLAFVLILLAFRSLVIAATDTGNPYGTTLKWPAAVEESGGRAPTRTVGALVVLVNGALAAYVPRGGRQVTAYLPEDEPGDRTTVIKKEREEEPDRKVIIPEHERD